MTEFEYEYNQDNPLIVFIGRRPRYQRNPGSYFPGGYFYPEDFASPVVLEDKKEIKTPTHKYIFTGSKSSDSFCPICLENFKLNDTMCINSCYHYWCESCESKFKKLVCPLCRIPLESNIFLDSKGTKGEFKNLPCFIEPIEIIKKDLDLLDDISSSDYDEEIIIQDIDYIISNDLLNSID